VDPRARTCTCADRAERLRVRASVNVRDPVRIRLILGSDTRKLVESVREKVDAVVVVREYRLEQVLLASVAYA